MSDRDDMQGESTMLRRLLGLIMAPASEHLWAEMLPPGMRATAAATYFLLDVEPGRDAETFVGVTLRRLLQQLTRRTEQQKVMFPGQVRGRICWSSTFKARYSQGYDPTRYVCREVRRQYNTPENQLVKYMVTQIDDCLKLVPQVLRNGSCYYPVNQGLTTVHHVTAIRLRNIEEVLNTSRAQSRLRDITLPQVIDESHLVRAETSRTEEYAEVARLYRRYRHVVLSLSWNGLVTVGKRVLPLPVGASPDEDSWIRLGAAILRA